MNEYDRMCADDDDEAPTVATYAVQSTPEDYPMTLEAQRAAVVRKYKVTGPIGGAPVVLTEDGAQGFVFIGWTKTRADDARGE